MPEAHLPNLLRAAGSGVLFDFQDELEGGAKAVLSGDPSSYARHRDAARRSYDRYAEEHPYLANGTAIAAGVLPTLAAAVIPGGQGAAAANAARVAVPAAKAASRLAVRVGPKARVVGTALGDAGLSALGQSKEKGLRDMPQLIAENLIGNGIMAGGILGGQRAYRGLRDLSAKYFSRPKAQPVSRAKGGSVEAAAPRISLED